MKLEVAIKGMLDTESKLRSIDGVNNPIFISTQMARLSNYVGAVEEHLADLEKDFEIQAAMKLKQYLVEEKLAATAADKRLKIDTGELKGQIVYLGRLVGSAWKQIGVAQSRVNHLVREAQTQI